MKISFFMIHPINVCCLQRPYKTAEIFRLDSYNFRSSWVCLHICFLLKIFKYFLVFPFLSYLHLKWVFYSLFIVSLVSFFFHFFPIRFCYHFMLSSLCSFKSKFCFSVFSQTSFLKPVVLYLSLKNQIF